MVEFMKVNNVRYTVQTNGGLILGKCLFVRSTNRWNFFPKEGMGFCAKVLLQIVRWMGEPVASHN